MTENREHLASISDSAGTDLHFLEAFGFRTRRGAGRDAVSGAQNPLAPPSEGLGIPPSSLDERHAVRSRKRDLESRPTPTLDEFLSFVVTECIEGRG